MDAKMTDFVKSSKNSTSKVKFCRICGQESEKGQILFHFNQEIQQRAVEIFSYISLSLKYIRFYPNWICPGCELQLESTCQFFDLIRNGQRMLCERFGDLPRRGRRPKKKKMLLPEHVSQSEEEPIVMEDGSKRAIQTPLRLKDTMKGDELEELYTEIGITKKTNRLSKSKTKLIAHIENEEGNSLGEMLAIPKNPQRTCTRYQCDVCKELFCAELAFFKHVATHKNIQYECTECEKSFPSKSLFDDHQLSENHKGLGIIETPFLEITSEEPLQAVEEVPLQADKAHETIQETSTIKTTPVSIQTTAKQIVKRYTCIKCSKSFTTKTSMQRHQVTHSNARPFKCDICTASFKQRTTLTVHRNSHTRERHYKCARCPKSFIHQQTLKSHMRMHDGLKPYVCTICKKGFRQMVNLIDHKRVHTGERPYVCLICGSAFKTSSQCRTHQNVHKTAEERPPKPIEVENIHKTHNCRLCNKLFSHKSAMVKHLRTHTGEKPYVCYMCPKSFSDPSNFKKHKEVHAKQNEQRKVKAVSLLKPSQAQVSPHSDPDPDGLMSMESIKAQNVQINRSLIDMLDEDNDRTSKRWGLLRESSDPIITEIQNDDSMVESQQSLANQLVCVSYQDPMNPVTNKTTFYVVN